MHCSPQKDRNSLNSGSSSSTLFTMNFRLLILSILCATGLLSTPMLPAQNTAAVNRIFQNWTTDPDLSGATWSSTVIDIESGNVLVSVDPDRILATASTMKVVTTATAFAILGPDYKFNTYFEMDGNIQAGGVLYGNVYLRGEGDPSLGSSRWGEARSADVLMANWAETLKSKGVKVLKGAVIGDASIFGSQMVPDGWGWEDIGNYYGAGVSGLNFAENYYELHLRTGSKVGSRAEILRTDPFIPGMSFINELYAGPAGSGDRAYIFGGPYTFERYVRGTIPASSNLFVVKGSIPDPALYAAQRLQEELIKCGIKVEGGATTVRAIALSEVYLPPNRELISTYTSPPLSEIIYHTNKRSVNLFAEALACRVAVARGQEGSTESAVRVIESYWESKGLPKKSMQFADGSGLSPNNGTSTRFMTSLLRKATTEPWFDDFYASLPVAGESGTLENMLKGTRAAGNLHAKSGFIEGVRAYAGYVRTRSNRMLAFSLVSTRYSCTAGQMRQKMEAVMAALAELE